MFRFEFLYVAANQVQDMSVRRTSFIFCDKMQFLVKDMILVSYPYMVFFCFFHEFHPQFHLTCFVQ